MSATNRDGEQCAVTHDLLHLLVRIDRVRPCRLGVCVLGHELEVQPGLVAAGPLGVGGRRGGEGRRRVAAVDRCMPQQHRAHRPELRRSEP